MGFFNAMSSINRVNNLLKDLESQVTITQGLIASGATRYNLENSLNVHKRIHQDLMDAFAGSSAARVSVFKIFGDSMRMDDVLMYSKNLILHLMAIIQSR